MLNIKNLNVNYIKKGNIKVIKLKQKFNFIKTLIKLRRLLKENLRQWIKINLINTH